MYKRSSTSTGPEPKKMCYRSHEDSDDNSCYDGEESPPYSNCPSDDEWDPGYDDSPPAETLAQMDPLPHTKMPPLNDFLKNHHRSNIEDPVRKREPPTHTRIKSEQHNVFGGAFAISHEELPIFWQSYKDHVFTKKRAEHLTERQLEENGPILVDFDLKYPSTVDTRKHADHHIESMINIFLDCLKNIYEFDEDDEFPIYIMQKSDVVKQPDGKDTKDGIHMIIGLSSSRVIQHHLRSKVLDQLDDAWESLGLTNNIESVVDEGIAKGSVNWPLYGSRKPGKQPYLLTNWYSCHYTEQETFSLAPQAVQSFNVMKTFEQLSAQFDGHPKFSFHEDFVDEHDKLQENVKRRTSASPNRKMDDDDESGWALTEEQVDMLINDDALDGTIDAMLSHADRIDPDNAITEAHQYTQILPEKYYCPGSHALNRQVAFALKNTSDILFLSWIKLRSKADDFEFDSIPGLFASWNNHFNVGGSGKLTLSSLRFWAKRDAPKEYRQIKESSIDHFVETSLSNQTEYDVAMVLYQCVKDTYTCVSYDKGGIWYKYDGTRWILDKGERIRSELSNKIHNLYSRKGNALMKIFRNDPDDENAAAQAKAYNKMVVMCKTRRSKDNIMKEAKEIFYDDKFIEKMDSNPMLMCFENGVVDFESKTFRGGMHTDYITKCTNTVYTDVNAFTNDQLAKKATLENFMNQLFPDKETCEYMWDYLASTAIGKNTNQTVAMFFGDGSNGKSRLMELMSQAYGDYKATCPLALVTGKRVNIGNTSSEIIQLKAVRFAVMHEPSKNTVINDGPFKELSGGDPLTGRGLYRESETFIPQFSLAVCMNSMFNMQKATDGGSTRRVKKVDFLSRFILPGDTTTYDIPEKYKFPADMNIDEVLKECASVFGSMLIARAFKTNGVVEDCPAVKKSTNKYNQSQDSVGSFIGNRIIKTTCKHDKINKNALVTQFKNWYDKELGDGERPKNPELYEIMTKKFGENITGWTHVKFVEVEEEESESDEETDEETDMDPRGK